MFSSNATQVSAVTQAEAVDFDGTNDYLLRSSDLTGNADGKTFTFSAWVWTDTNDATDYILSNWDGANGDFYVFILNTGEVSFVARNTSNTIILQGTSSVALPLRTWSNLQISIDLASTSNRYVAINDVIDSSVTWSTYSNQTIDFTASSWNISQTGAGGSRFEGRLSNVFLDYTYRDLTVEANRRLFVTADLKPAAGQAALNPILYLPMSDPTTVGTNSGTGGNFTLTGTVARSGRGPNQYNAPYSDLDGSADYLSRTTAPTGIADSKTFTFSFCVQPDAVTTANRDVIAFGQDSANPAFFVRMTSGGELEIQGYNAAGSVFALGANTGTVFKNGRNYVVTVSVDMSDTGKRHVYINGVVQSVTWSTYSNLTIDFNISTTPKYFIGKGLGTVYYDGRLGAVWFNTSYIDLSVASNLAKFVTGTGIDAKPVDLGASGELPTGTSPLIYLPMYGNNAGKNYGTGGDFTVNSGPYTGARGPNEFWGNKANFGNSTGNYLVKTGGLTGASSSSTTWSISCWFYYNDNTSNCDIFSIGGSGFQLVISSGTFFMFTGSSSYLESTTSISTGVWHNLLVSRNSATSYSVYLDGVALSFTRVGSNASNLAADTAIGVRYNSAGSQSEQLNGQLAELYFAQSAIDFSSEANRLLFRNCFGNPTDLPSAITAATVPTPLMYMRFDPASQVTNAGTGGNFTKFGTISDGGQL